MQIISTAKYKTFAMLTVISIFLGMQLCANAAESKVAVQKLDLPEIEGLYTGDFFSSGSNFSANENGFAILHVENNNSTVRTGLKICDEKGRKTANINLKTETEDQYNRASNSVFFHSVYFGKNVYLVKDVRGLNSKGEFQKQELFLISYDKNGKKLFEKKFFSQTKNFGNTPPIRYQTFSLNGDEHGNIHILTIWDRMEKRATHMTLEHFTLSENGKLLSQKTVLEYEKLFKSGNITPVFASNNRLGYIANYPETNILHLFTGNKESRYKTTNHQLFFNDKTGKALILSGKNLYVEDDNNKFVYACDLSKFAELKDYFAHYDPDYRRPPGMSGYGFKIIPKDESSYYFIAYEVSDVATMVANVFLLTTN